MRTTFFGLILSLGSLLATSVAFAGDADDKVLKAQAEASLANLVKAANDSCGGKIDASVNWTGFPLADLNKYSFSGYVEPIFDALKKFCEGKKAKAFIAAEVKKVVVGFGGKEKRALGVANGTIDYKIDWEAGNSAEHATKMLILKL